MKEIAAILAYPAVFIVTYGHAYTTSGAQAPGAKMIEAAFVSLFWPLYWSVEAWK